MYKLLCHTFFEKKRKDKTVVKVYLSNTIVQFFQEWVWPVGWLLRAQLAIAPKVGGFEELGRTMGHVKSLLAPHLTHVLSDAWRSLPELTNTNGAHCKDSNPAQAWSTGCVLEVSFGYRSNFCDTVVDVQH